MVLGVVLSLCLRDCTSSYLSPSMTPVNRILHTWRHILIVAAMSYKSIIFFANALGFCGLWGRGDNSLLFYNSHCNVNMNDKNMKQA